ncbi:hypothetical protein BP5796_00793 [Coleophoma crateriformis]|uniref:Uncharacterized protein n=1 Tax=Coleophoma crateriformis TaxID=565419 RepID=A0A3D8T8Z3_9HELO|nr:hypothetical protein BP5796_00793 [Coleophoma crateriformis]
MAFPQNDAYGIVVGRRKEKLDSFVNKHAEGKAAAVELDIKKLDRTQPKQTSIVYTSSKLGIVPMVRAPKYGASKAALHHFVLALREQMKDGPGNVNVVEIFPPAVQTELHDGKHQPDLKNGHQIGIPLQELIDSTRAGLVKDDEQIAVGLAKGIFDAVEPTRQRILRDLHAQLTKILQDFLV